MDSIERALRYRNKSEEVMSIAEQMRDLEIKQFLAGVAADYVMFAQAIERMEVADPLPASE
jgi:hypothetical protein